MNYKPAIDLAATQAKQTNTSQTVWTIWRGQKEFIVNHFDYGNDPPTDEDGAVYQFVLTVHPDGQRDFPRTSRN